MQREAHPVLAQPLAHLLEPHHGMHHFAILEEADGLEGRAEIDLFQGEQPVLAPPVEEMGDILLERLKAGLSVSLRIEHLGPQLENELHAARGVDEPLEQTLAR